MIGGFNRWRSVVVALGSLGLTSWMSLGADTLAAARESVTQWVQTQQLISRTRADWESDREMLQQSKALLERELAVVRDEMAKQNTNSGAADIERRKAEAELKRSNEALEQARTVLGALEGRIKELLPLLPMPVTAGAQQLINKLPADPAQTKSGAAERMQTVVSLLNEVDKFNNAVTVFTEKRKNEKGEEVSVETVYAGLGAAFFVNESGDFAGHGHPGPKGWEWSIDAAMAPDVREVIRIYRNERSARFVPLPVAIQ